MTTASGYLTDYYVEAAQALRYFEESYDEGKSSQAREALNKAASLICTAFNRLADDQGFWDSLAALREPIEKNQAAIGKILNDIDLFIAVEETVLLDHKLPAAIVRQLLSDLTLTLKTFRVDSDLTALQSGIRGARDTICAISTLDGEPRDQFFRVVSAIRDALGVLGGAVTILVDVLSSAAQPLALASIIAGVSSSLGFFEWLRRRRNRGG